MAFPTTGVLDSFNAGANQNLTARSGWGASVLFTGDTSLTTNATPDRARTGGVVTYSNFYNTSYGADSECWVTMITAIASNGLDLYARITATGTVTAYNLSVTTAGLFQLGKYITGTGTNLGSSATQAVAAGDSIGLEVIGSTLKGYYKAAAGGWTQLVSATDSAITTAGNIGFDMSGSSPNEGFDLFAGGTVVASTALPQPSRVVRTIRGAGA